jgi:hypothetical protein
MGLFSRFRNKPLQRKNIRKSNSIEIELRNKTEAYHQEYNFLATKRRNYKEYMYLLELSKQKITRKEFDKNVKEFSLQLIADELNSVDKHISNYIKQHANEKIVKFLGTSKLQEANSNYKQLNKKAIDAQTKYLIDRSVLYKFQGWRVGVGEESWDEAKARAKAEREVKSINIKIKNY